MRSARGLSGVVLAAATLAACHADVHVGADFSDGGSNLEYGDREVRIRRTGGPDAHVTADGRLAIGGQDVAVSDADRTQLVAFYDAAERLKDHAIATGKAGANVGVTAASEAVKGLMQGDMSKVGPKVETEAAVVKAEAGKICDDLDGLRRAQEALAADVAAFRPYAAVKPATVAKCRDDTHPGAAH